MVRIFTVTSKIWLENQIFLKYHKYILCKFLDDSKKKIPLALTDFQKPL